MVERITQKQFSSSSMNVYFLIRLDIKKNSVLDITFLSLIKNWKTLDNQRCKGAILKDLSKTFDSSRSWAIKEQTLISPLVLTHTCKENTTRISFRISFINIYLNTMFYFLDCNICNFADNTAPNVCIKNLDVVLEQLEQRSSFALK